jgi:Xaa-Pro aminopeptidase
MAKLLYASSSKDSDMFYAVRTPIPDAFFYLDTGDHKYVFLDHREYGVFEEHLRDTSFRTNEGMRPAEGWSASGGNPDDTESGGISRQRIETTDVELVLVNPLMEFASAQALARSESVVGWLAYMILEKYAVLNEPIEVSNNLPLEMADFLRAKEVSIVVKNPFFPERLRKAPYEVDAIREALVRTQHAYTHIEEVLRNATIDGDSVIYQGEPLTSERLKSEAEKILLSHDMTNDEGIIISCAGHAAIPHHRGAGMIRPHQTIVCDIFPRHRETGYFADMTRTYVKGEPSEEIAKMYAAVLEAQERAIEQVKPGVTMGDIHQSCIDTFLDKGYHHGDKGFVHGTGHGLGIDIHEYPYVRRDSHAVFEPGHVVTIEPGLYYPDIGGVRIEDVVVVTDDGCRNLTDYHKEYIIL